MKLKFFFALNLVVGSLLLFSGCDKELFCEGRGELTVTNKSLHTVQQILIDGTNYGTIDPEESKTIELPAGKYTLELEGLSGGSGCGASQVTIDACGSVGRSCSY